ncbi:hypothetical protein [Caulobacter rhizosphaerae]|jgi:hypothetical protein|uniref:hypothetical protein n=1 Tax=Caulobacter rhizosphaerae TaxID=2010972 RepID=UPI0013D2C2CA|nr:hypothetical protein [Caulobacter rhizosphaerae]GGL13147.1 hypothetical protein GCM10010983_07970 [Caulobacter rhizosphaerae]
MAEDSRNGRGLVANQQTTAHLRQHVERSQTTAHLKAAVTAAKPVVAPAAPAQPQSTTAGTKK